ncbi:MAG TPA: DUF5695 domain-containing protein [Terracidiphilus sp.]|nr:DUF5695 domain-containing protein [Terracidiphilus sp.]
MEIPLQFWSGEGYLEASTWAVDQDGFASAAFHSYPDKMAFDPYSGNAITVEPRDSFRQRVYLAPLGLWLTLHSGRFERVTLNKATGAVEVQLAPADTYTPTALLRIEQEAHASNVSAIAPLEKLTQLRGAWAVDLGATGATIHLGRQLPVDHSL